MNDLIIGKVSTALKGHWANPDLASSLQYEMLLLTDSISKEDSCWELRLRCGELGTIGWALFRKPKGATLVPG